MFLILAMDSFSQFSSSFEELVDQWRRVTVILRDMEEKALCHPQILEKIRRFKSTCIEVQNFQVCHQSRF